MEEEGVDVIVGDAVLVLEGDDELDGVSVEAAVLDGDEVLVCERVCVCVGVELRVPEAVSVEDALDEEDEDDDTVADGVCVKLVETLAAGVTETLAVMDGVIDGLPVDEGVMLGDTPSGSEAVGEVVAEADDVAVEVNEPEDVALTVLVGEDVLDCVDERVAVAAWERETEPVTELLGVPVIVWEALEVPVCV